MIRCNSKLFNIGSWTILLLPKSASAKLPSRGMTMVEGRLNGSPFQAPLEPDGKGSHWLKVDKTLLKTARAEAGDTVTLEIAPSKEWPRPDVPEDIKNAITNAPPAHSIWQKITANAQWDWIRWIRSTKQPDTRKRRIEIACSKLASGTRRPCCFNRNMCTEPYVSNNGVLFDQKL